MAVQHEPPLSDPMFNEGRGSELYDTCDGILSPSPVKALALNKSEQSKAHSVTKSKLLSLRDSGAFEGLVSEINEKLANAKNYVNQASVLEANENNAQAFAKSSRPSKKELAVKIAHLEREIEKLTVAHSYTLSAVGSQIIIPDVKNDPELALFDIAASSQGSSPTKMPTSSNRKSFINSNRRSLTKQNVRPESNLKDCATFRITKDTKKELDKAEQIMFRGFRTAREINQNMELLTRQAAFPRKSQRDVALQVCFSKDEERDDDDDDSACFALAKELTTALIQKPIYISEDCEKKDHHNVHHVVMSAEESRKVSSLRNLTVQRLPDEFIKGELTLQCLPSLDISPESAFAVHKPDNTRVCVVKHNADTATVASPLSSVNEANDIYCDIVNEEKMISAENTTRKELVDTCIQIDLSQGSPSITNIHHKKRLDLEQQISKFVEQYKNKNVLNKCSESEKITDLAKKVRASGEVCERYRKRDQQPKLDVRREEKFRTLQENDVNSGILVEALVLSNEDRTTYTSDFDVESADHEESSKLKYSCSFSGSEVKTKESNSSKTVASLSLSPNASLSSIKSASVLGQGDHNASRAANESFIEMQMKRLGMSPERHTSLKRSHRKSETKRKHVEKKSSHPSKARNMQKNSSVTRSRASDVSSDNQLYVKSNGRFIPVEPSPRSNVQIIVPEIIVKLPEPLKSSVNRDVECLVDLNLASNKTKDTKGMDKKQDQVVQTDEGCATMTSGETSLVVDKINKHFERTQLLIERMGAPHSSRSRAKIGEDALSLLHRRKQTWHMEDDSSCESEKITLKRQLLSPEFYRVRKTQVGSGSSRSISSIGEVPRQ